MNFTAAAQQLDEGSFWRVMGVAEDSVQVASALDARIERFPDDLRAEAVRLRDRSAIYSAIRAGRGQ